jgi:hypothetical protein
LDNTNLGIRDFEICEIGVIGVIGGLKLLKIRGIVFICEI